MISQSLSIRPSELLAIKDDLTKFYFDRAVWRFGVSVNADIEAIDPALETAKIQQQQVLDVWLDIQKVATETEQTEITIPQGRFRDPFAQ